MNQGSKILILIAILMVPVVIYTFLKVFGQNEFYLPVYYAESGDKSLTSNDTENLNSQKVQFPDLYDSEGQPIDMEALYDNIIIIELILPQVNIKARDHKVNRISDIFKNEENVLFLRVFEEACRSESSFYESIHPGHNNISICIIEFDALGKIAESQLALDIDANRTESVENLVLVDRKQRIRGYYNLQDFEDIDRLILEIKILLNQKPNV